MGQGHALARGAPRQEDGAHAGGQAYADGAHVGPHDLHGVVDGQPGLHDPAGRVDVQADVPVGVIGLQKEELGHHQVGHVVVYGRAQEDDPVLQEPGIYVVGSFTPARLLDHHGHKVHGLNPPLQQPGYSAASSMAVSASAASASPASAGSSALSSPEPPEAISTSRSAALRRKMALSTWPLTSDRSMNRRISSTGW